MEYGDKEDLKADILADSERIRARFKIEITGMCKRCENAHIYSTPRSPAPAVLCMGHSDSMRMPTDVSECSKFSQIGTLSSWQLAKLALDVDFAKPKSAGFKPEDKP